MSLTDVACKRAKPKDKPYKMADSGGLYLHIMPTGSKLWKMKYRHGGKEKLLSFGPYPITTLAEARDKQYEAKRLLSEDIDPSAARKAKKRQQIRNSQNTFKAVALEWHENQLNGWSDSHAKHILNRLETDVFPHIGADAISSIEPPELLDVLRKIEKRGALDIAGRTRQICGQIFRYGIQTGKCSRDPSADLRGALKTRKTTHFAALESSDIAELLEALERNDARLYGRTRRAIKLSLLTFVRPGELRQAEWSEINFDEKLWVIPGRKMKMGRDHIVPLADQAIDLLLEQQEETSHLQTPWVFPSLVRPRNPISDGTVNNALKRMGFKGKQTAHGFSALARTAIREKLEYDPDVIEVQLAHKPANPLGAAYDRTQFIDQRKTMMEAWADYLDGLSARKQSTGG